MAPNTILSIRPFTKDDASFFAELASYERMTRYVGDGQPWTPDMIAARMRIALAETPVHVSGAVRWLLAMDHLEPVGLLASTRRDS